MRHPSDDDSDRLDPADEPTLSAQPAKTQPKGKPAPDAKPAAKSPPSPTLPRKAGGGDAQPDVKPEPAGGDPHVGTQLGKYRLVAMLGRGGMGVVYEAEDTLLKRRVALKLLPESVANDQEALRRFLLEAQAAAKLNHPNAVGIFEVENRGKLKYIVMELVKGGSAADFIKAKGPFNWPEATRIIADACRGLAAAHEAGLIHRDIKPANIMRSEEGVVKLADFGLAKSTERTGESITGAGNIVGTPEYMSPEQCRGEAVDFRSDVYSLGATYYALLAGRSPYARSGSAMQVMFAHCSEPVPDVRRIDPIIPERCAAVVQRAMAKEAGDRYASAAEMAADLDAILASPATADSGSGAKPEWSAFVNAVGTHPRTATITRVRPMPKRAGGRSLLLPAVAGGFAVVALVVGALMVFRSGPPKPVDGPVVKGPSPKDDDETKGRTDPDPTPEIKPEVKPETKPESKPETKPDIKAPPPNLAPPPGWTPQPRTVVAGSGVIRTLAFSPDGRRLAAGGHVAVVTVWDTETGNKVFSATGHEDIVAAAAYSPDGSLLATGSHDRTVRLWDAATGEKRHVLRRHEGQLTSLAFSPDGRTLYSGAADRTVRSWNTGDGTGGTVLLRTDTPVHGLAVSPDGSTLAVGTFGDGTVRLLELPSGRPAGRLENPSGPVFTLAYSRDGRTLAAGTRDNAVRLWRREGGPPAVLPHYAPVEFAAFTPDGARLITCSDNSMLTVWDAAAVRSEGVYLQAGTTAAVSPDGRFVAAGGAGGRIKIWAVPNSGGAPHPGVDEAWVKGVLALPSADDRLERVIAKLKQLNPGFEGPVNSPAGRERVTELAFNTELVADISPLRALPDLESLMLNAAAAGDRTLADLTPLKGMKLRVLHIGGTRVASLAPLAGMPLTQIYMTGAPVADLSPLAGMKLNRLDIGRCPVADLSPLKGMPIDILWAYDTRISNLSPLAGMPIKELHIHHCPVRDVSPLRGTELTHLYALGTPIRDFSPLRETKLVYLLCELNPWRDLEALRSIPTLQQINNAPAAEMLKAAEGVVAEHAEWANSASAMKMEERAEAVGSRLPRVNPKLKGKMELGWNGANDKVIAFAFRGDGISEVAPLAVLTDLQDFTCGSPALGNLYPIRGLKLVRVNLAGSGVEDLTPLAGMPVTELDIRNTPATDLAPLRDMPLRVLHADSELVRRSPVLRGIRTLRTINDRPADEVLGGGAAARAEHDAWLKSIEGLPPREKVEAVAARLHKLNPDRNGKVKPALDKDGKRVVSVVLEGDGLTDVSPLAALTDLAHLSVSSSSLTDLEPLRPLRLERISLAGTGVTDLSPLADMPLEFLNIKQTPITDLRAIEGFRAIKYLHCDIRGDADLAVLRKLPMLKQINGKAAAEFWREAGTR